MMKDLIDVRALSVMVAVIVSLTFGAADQYLGSFPVVHAVGFWTISVSLLSAPWLVLPFLFGCTQERSSRAALLGLAVTLSALAGYFLIIMGPFEGGQWTLTLKEVVGLLRSNGENIVGGMVTCPLYGFLGQQWRTRRAWLSALLVTTAVSLEPLAQTAARKSYPGLTIVGPIETSLGIVAGVVFLAAGIASRRRGGRPVRALVA